MIVKRNQKEIECLRKAGEVVGLCHKYLKQFIKAGVKTKELDSLAKKFIESKGCTCSFLGLYDFPGAICISVNNEVVHGIGGDRVLMDGDILKLDIGACYKGYHGDSAWTYVVGNFKNDKDEFLFKHTEEALFRALKKVKDGVRVGCISHEIEACAHRYNLGLVRELGGHGVGNEVHMDPIIPNFGSCSDGEILHSGNVIAIEPVFTSGSRFICLDKDKNTIITNDDSNSAHFEHTILITDTGYEILTRRDIPLGKEDIILK